MGSTQNKGRVLVGKENVNEIKLIFYLLLEFRTNHEKTWQLNVENGEFQYG